MYPTLVRALLAVARLDYSAVAPSLSLVLGAVAMVVVFVLMERAVSRFCACVLLTCTFLAAPVMQLVYPKSLTGIKARMAGRVRANTRRAASELSRALTRKRGDLSCVPVLSHTPHICYSRGFRCLA